MHMCHGLCSRYKINRDATPKKSNGFTRIYERAVYCKACAVYFDKKDAYKALLCPCCHRKLRTRPKSRRDRIQYSGLYDSHGRPIKSLPSLKDVKLDDSI